MYYYAKDKAFLSAAIHKIPSGAVRLTNEEYAGLLESQALGMEIGHDDLGRPFASARPAAAVSQVTRAQGKAALIRAGLWQGVLDYVASIEDATEKAVAEVALHDTSHYQRTSPFLNDAAHALGLTDEQLDDLFIQASKIEL